MSDNDNVSLSRRSFLSLSGRVILWASALLSSVGIFRYLSYKPQSSRKMIFELGAASQYPIGSVSPIPEAKAVVVSSQNGLQAFSTICPHLGCEVNWEASHFTCPCHGSRFAIDGSLMKGPATTSLVKLVLETNDLGEVVLKLSS